MSARPRTSTRLAIATQALDDARERLETLPEGEQVKELREELRGCAFEVRACMLDGASAEDRAQILERVLRLHVEVTRLARELEGDPQ